MIKPKLNSSYEYIIVGTGAAGGTLAYELSKAGKSVLIIERGAWHKKALGFPFGLRLLHGYAMFSKSKEGAIVGRGITVGGSTMVYNANVFTTPDFIYEKMGIDFRAEVNEIKNDIAINSLPDRFFENAHGGNRVREAAYKMGIPFKSQNKFINPDKCKIGCDWCMIGCRYNAKWTSRELILKALSHSADLMCSTPVNNILFNKNRRAIGVTLKNKQNIYGEKIIVSAGGIGTAEILLRSGLKNVGRNFFIDPMDIVTGYADTESGGAWKEMTFTHAITDFVKDGFIIGNVGAANVASLPLGRTNVLKKNLFKFLPWIKRGIGLFVKLADNHNGEIYENKRFSKPFDDDDRRRMSKGTGIAKEILTRAGIRPSTIVVAESIGGHPGGTAAMGKVVDNNFQTEFKNLYICDASVLPVSPGIPPSLTIMGMSKFFAKKLLGKTKKI